MDYFEQAPDPAHAHLIVNYWKFGIPDDLDAPFPHIIPPDGCISLVFSLNTIIPFRLVELSGAGFGMKETDIPPGTTFIGARLRPEAYPCLFDIPVAEVMHQFVDLAHLPDLAAMLAAMTPGFDDFHMQGSYLRQRRAPNALVGSLVDDMLTSEGNVRVGTLLAGCPLSSRQLQRRFLCETGITVKEFARLQRMRRSIISLHNEAFSLTDTALEQGFADQSHFIREAVKMSRQNPGRLRELYWRIRVQQFSW
ncbi:MAG: hypothetical protein OHK0039_33270 [Bacteroidia bacterium]